jgi:ribosome-associated protein
VIKDKTKRTEALIDAIVKGLQEKKGEEITLINLTETDNSVCDYFIICSANSTTQAEALCNSVEEFTEKLVDDNPKYIEGKRNAMWILMDYFNVIVHIFYKETREQFGLEKLWADGKVELVEELNP